jgi:hypothetical protein
VFWQPDLYTRTVILAPAPRVAADTIAYQPALWRGEFMTRRGDDGLHALLTSGPVQHRLWLPREVREGDPLVCVLPLGQAAATGAQAALAFWRHVGGRRSGPWHRDPRLDRSALALRALDAHAAGASYRTLAETLFGPQRVSAEAWKTSSVRDATIRLVRTGLSLMAGEYRRLLRLRADA